MRVPCDNGLAQSFLFYYELNVIYFEGEITIMNQSQSLFLNSFLSSAAFYSHVFLNLSITYL